MDKIFLSFDRLELKSLIKEAVFEVMAERDHKTSNETTLINVQEAAALLNVAVKPCGVHASTLKILVSDILLAIFYTT